MGEREQLAADIREALDGTTLNFAASAPSLLVRALAVLEPEEPARPEQCPRCKSRDRKARGTVTRDAPRDPVAPAWILCPDPWHFGGEQ